MNRRILTENIIKTILELRKQGVSRRQIAKTYNVNENSIYLLEKGKIYKDILSKLGYYHEPIVERVSPKLKHRKLNDEHIIEIFSLYNSGEKIKNITNKFNISYTLLQNILNGKAYKDIIDKYNLKKAK